MSLKDSGRACTPAGTDTESRHTHDIDSIEMAVRVSDLLIILTVYLLSVRYTFMDKQSNNL